MKTELLDNINRDDAVITSIDNLAGKEDMTLVSAAKNGNRRLVTVDSLQR